MRFLIACLLLLSADICFVEALAEPDTIKIVQSKLRAQGYDAGNVDGTLNEKTRAAIKSYQADWSLTVSGEITSELVERLERRHPDTKPHWQKAENQDCVVWNSAPGAAETVIWKGDCLEGKATGRGELEWTLRRNGQIAKSNGQLEFRAGLINGKGLLIESTGDRYEGEFLDGKRHGKGIYTGVKGNRYEGDFRDGKRHGHGIYVWANQDRYEGQFQDGKPNGNGTFFDAALKKTYTGNFEKGCLKADGRDIAALTTKKSCGFE